MVTRLVFRESSSYILMAAVGRLLILDLQACELTIFFSTLKLDGDFKVFFVSDENFWGAMPKDDVLNEVLGYLIGTALVTGLDKSLNLASQHNTWCMVAPNFEVPFIQIGYSSGDEISAVDQQVLDAFNDAFSLLTLEFRRSDEAWNGILNDWYKKTMGNPPNPQVPVANVNAEQNASKHQDEGESFYVGQIHAAENRTTLPHPVCSSSSFEYAVPSSSRTVIGASACGESTVRDATGFSQREKREDLSVVYGDINRGQKPPGERRHKCQVCDKLFQKESTLKRHWRTHTGEKPHHCFICQKSLSEKRNLTDHMLTHTGERPHRCNVCDKSFALKNALARHRRMHAGDKPYHCNTCDKSFAQKNALTIHIRMHTGEKPYHCGFCDKSFVQKGNLTRHLRMHTGDKTYQCGSCDISFVRKVKFILHIRMHTCDKPYQCGSCNKSFAQKSDLSRHLHVHTGDKRYQCGSCDKSFARKNHLILHIRMHTGDKPYQCGSCDKSFAQKSDLTGHLHMHTGDKACPCGSCSKSFERKYNLTGHLCMHTGEKP
ncbi:uncharacterized protein LOC119181679 [Rhipicephalus microplus]|uniref:uncharacterized protein LOC119181679 n=1 Tax=Rhipicephalus microplus TaxID=6941 RepID=UPI003F6C8598